MTYVPLAIRLEVTVELCGIRTATVVYAGTVTLKLLPTPLIGFELMPEEGVEAPLAKLALPKVYWVPVVASVAPEIPTVTVVLLEGSSLISSTATCPSVRLTP